VIIASIQHLYHHIFLCLYFLLCCFLFVECFGSCDHVDDAPFGEDQEQHFKEEQ
jgi:hypothetical protein